MADEASAWRLRDGADVVEILLREPGGGGAPAVEREASMREMDALLWRFLGGDAAARRLVQDIYARLTGGAPRGAAEREPWAQSAVRTELTEAARSGRIALRRVHARR
jgi:hypothetical protein